MTASSYVGWTVAGWSPGVAWTPSRTRFQVITPSAACVAGAAGAAGTRGAAGLLVGTQARAAQVKAATLSVVNVCLTIELQCLGRYLLHEVILQRVVDTSSRFSNDHGGHARDNRDEREDQYAGLRGGNRKIERRLRG